MLRAFMQKVTLNINFRHLTAFTLMLKRLSIKNYVLIREMELLPSEQLSIVTGETGAGKSIMLGAIGLLTGARADTKSLFDTEQKCVIEGVFDLREFALKSVFEALDLDYETETTIRREISPAGKSRAFINDTPVNLDAMRRIGNVLVDVHSQHDTLLLAGNDYQLGVVDSFAGNAAERKAYQKAYAHYRQAEAAHRQLLKEVKEAQSALDYNQHLLKELEALPLDELDQAALEEELEKLENAEAIKAALNEALELISRSEFSAESTLKQAGQAFNGIRNYAATYAELAERLRSLQVELADISFEVEKEDANLVLDEERILFIKEQLDQLYQLQKRHRLDSVDELITLRESLREKVEKVLHFDDELEAAEQTKKAAWQQLLKQGEALTQSREGVLQPLAAELVGYLRQLGIPDAQVLLQRSAQEPDESGFDLVEILFSANKGKAPEPLRQVASGGEFSRLMLVIKYVLANKTQLPTIIFDEIDTGISGEIAIKVGKMMQEMSKQLQVLAISHLPQIAAKGDRHYFVYKDNSSERTISMIRELHAEERVQEIAQMIGGAKPSEVAYQSARELMGG